MAYTFKYQLQEAPVASTNGTGVISFLINAIYSADGINYVVIPGFTRNLLVPSSKLKIVMDMPHGMEAQKTAKTNALKQALKESVYMAEPSYKVPDWSIEGMSLWVTSNDAAKVEADRTDAYITTTLGQIYPVDFSM
jgi:hypothetical protein